MNTEVRRRWVAMKKAWAEVVATGTPIRRMLLAFYIFSTLIALGVIASTRWLLGWEVPWWLAPFLAVPIGVMLLRLFVAVGEAVVDRFHLRDQMPTEEPTDG